MSSKKHSDLRLGNPHYGWNGMECRLSVFRDGSRSSMGADRSEECIAGNGLSEYFERKTNGSI